MQPLLNDKNFDLLDKLEALGRARGKTPAQMALGWLLTKDYIAAPIIGANTPEQLADSFAAGEKGALPADLKAKLDELTVGWRAVDAER